MVLMEITIRVTAWLNIPLAPPGHHKLFCEYDSILGWKHKPLASTRNIGSEYAVDIRFNSKGIRGDEYPYDKGDHEYRLLILGDSFAEGYNVAFEHLFSEVLKSNLTEHLKKTGTTCQVINTGTGGWGTDQEYLFYMNEGFKYDPDAVILMFYENDVWYNTQNKYWRGYKPKYRLESGQLTLTNVPVPQIGLSRGLSDTDLLEWLSFNSYLYSFLRNKAKNISFVRNWVLGLEFPREYGVWGRTYDTEIKLAWDTTERLIVDLKKQAIENGSRFIVFNIPNIACVYKDKWDSTKKLYALDEAEWDIDQPSKEIRRICLKNMIDLIDPTSQMIEQARLATSPGEKLYFSIDEHWTVRGHNLVAEIMGRYLMEKHLQALRQSQTVSD